MSANAEAAGNPGNADERSTNGARTKVTRPILSKYELTRALSVRAQQIANGAKTHVNPGFTTSPFTIAQMEQQQGELRLCSRRYLPSGLHEDYPVDELENMEQQYLSPTAKTLYDE